MDQWIGVYSEELSEEYNSRGGLTTVSNLLTPLIIVHGESDDTVPIEQARKYVQAANK